jgi:hypothetical protein
MAKRAESLRGAWIPALTEDSCSSGPFLALFVFPLLVNLRRSWGTDLGRDPGHVRDQLTAANGSGFRSAMI